MDGVTHEKLESIFTPKEAKEIFCFVAGEVLQQLYNDTAHFGDDEFRAAVQEELRKEQAKEQGMHQILPRILFLSERTSQETFFEDCML